MALGAHGTRAEENTCKYTNSANIFIDLTTEVFSGGTKKWRTYLIVVVVLCPIITSGVKSIEKQAHPSRYFFLCFFSFHVIFCFNFRGSENNITQRATGWTQTQRAAVRITPSCWNCRASVYLHVSRLCFCSFFPFCITFQQIDKHIFWICSIVIYLHVLSKVAVGCALRATVSASLNETKLCHLRYFYTSLQWEITVRAAALSDFSVDI